jgi:phage terminase large subunit GpA-like protein
VIVSAIAKLSPQAVDSLKRARRRYMPPERLGYGQWAEKYRMLVGGRSPGRFGFRGQPALRGVLAMLDNPAVRELWGMKSARFGWTEGVEMNVIGKRVHLDPCPIMVLFPKDGAGKRFMREKLVPAIRATPELRARINVEKRGPDNSQDYKEFEGGWIQLGGVNSPSNVKSSDAKVVIVAEPDDTSKNVQGQGDAVALGRERVKDHPDGLMVVGGTPTIKGFSKVDNGMEKTDKCRFYLSCPHCGHRQTLRFERVRWRKDAIIEHTIYGTARPDTAIYACESCVTEESDFTSAGCWSDTVKNRLILEASQRPDFGWSATAPFNGFAGVYINELISVSPGSTMRLMALKFLEAVHWLKKGDDKLMRSFINNQCGETWELRNDLPEVQALAERAEDYASWTTPAGGLIATAAVDVQRGGQKILGGLYIKVKTWGRGEESWRVAYEFIAGNVLEQDPWDKLDQMLSRSIRNHGGGQLGISAVSIDSNDGMTQDAVFRYVRKRKHLNYMAIKGSTNPHKEIFSPPSQSVDTTAIDKAARWGLRPYWVGVEKAKDLMNGRLKLTGSGPGRMHWNKDAPADYYEQMTSQVKMPGRSGRLLYQTKEGVRDEAPDLEVYNMHAARKLRVHAFTEADWLDHEARVRQPDLLTSKAEQQAPTTVSDGPRGTQGEPAAAQPFTGFGGARRGP